MRKRALKIGKLMCKNLQLYPREKVENLCRYCESYMTPVILKDELWDRDDMVICFDCIEKHVLKRKITINDLKIVPDNHPYFKGYEMCKVTL
ncbi:hypothetical protein [Flyfo podovirus Tbat2_2]|nr:hypothetical protein [Flyfo podovirus Tbat2_2]